MKEMHEPRGDATVPSIILPKVREARRIVEAARWGLLDVLIWLDEIQDDMTRGQQAKLRAAMDDLDVLGLTANRPDTNAREYQPDEDWSW